MKTATPRLATIKEASILVGIPETTLRYWFTLEDDPEMQGLFAKVRNRIFVELLKLKKLIDDEQDERVRAAMDLERG